MPAETRGWQPSPTETFLALTGGKAWTPRGSSMSPGETTLLTRTLTWAGLPSPSPRFTSTSPFLSRLGCPRRATLAPVGPVLVWTEGPGVGGRVRPHRDLERQPRRAGRRRHRAREGPRHILAQKSRPGMSLRLTRQSTRASHSTWHGCVATAREGLLGSITGTTGLGADPPPPHVTPARFPQAA